MFLISFFILWKCRSIPKPLVLSINNVIKLHWRIFATVYGYTLKWFPLSTYTQTFITLTPGERCWYKNQRSVVPVGQVPSITMHLFPWCDVAAVTPAPPFSSLHPSLLLFSFSLAAFSWVIYCTCWLYNLMPPQYNAMNSAFRRLEFDSVCWKCQKVIIPQYIYYGGHSRGWSRTVEYYVKRSLPHF